MASSDARAMAVDEVQYGQDDGPCLQALRTGTVIGVSDMRTEPRWGAFPEHAVENGVHSSLSLPLAAGSSVLGALNLYGPVPEAFSAATEIARAAALAAQASAVLTVVVRQAEQAQLTSQLTDALSSRSVIDQALGIVAAQQRCTTTAAFAMLRTASQSRNRKLRDIAADIVTSATGHAPQDIPMPGPS